MAPDTTITFKSNDLSRFVNDVLQPSIADLNLLIVKLMAQCGAPGVIERVKKNVGELESFMDKLCRAIEGIGTTVNPNQDATDLFVRVASGELTPVEAESLRVKRDARWQTMYDAAAEYYRVLQRIQNEEDPEVERLKLRLEEIAEPFSDQPAFAAWLRMERAGVLMWRAGVLGEEKT